MRAWAVGCNVHAVTSIRIGAIDSPCVKSPQLPHYRWFQQQTTPLNIESTPIVDAAVSARQFRCPPNATDELGEFLPDCFVRLCLGGVSTTATKCKQLLFLARWPSHRMLRGLLTIYRVSCATPNRIEHTSPRAGITAVDSGARISSSSM